MLVTSSVNLIPIRSIKLTVFVKVGLLENVFCHITTLAFEPIPSNSTTVDVSLSSRSLTVPDTGILKLNFVNYKFLGKGTSESVTSEPEIIINTISGYDHNASKAVA